MPEKLAIDGGVPVRTTPMPPWPSPSDAQIAAVEAVLRSRHINYWTGDEGRSLEREYAAQAHDAVAPEGLDIRVRDHQAVAVSPRSRIRRRPRGSAR